MRGSNLLLVLLLGVAVVFQGGLPSPPSPPINTPIGQYAGELAEQHGITQQQRQVIAQNFRSVADEIDGLVNPLSTSDIVKPRDALNKIHKLNYQAVPQWEVCCRELGAYIEAADELDADAGHPDRSIYAYAIIFRDIANGISPTFSQDEEIYGDESDIEQAYMNGAVGAFIDEEGQPDEYREAAQQGDAEFFDANGQYSSEAFPADWYGAGEGRRAVYFNYALRFDGNPTPVFKIKQETGNCVAASSGDVGISHLLGVSIFLLKKPYQWDGGGSTLAYAFRGHCGQGASLGVLAKAYQEYGYAVRKPYVDGKYNLRDSHTDQQLSRRHCSNPERTLADLIEETKQSKIGTISYFDGDVQEAIDIIYAGGVLWTGSTYTASKNGDPVCSSARVGPHAQTLIGYDDTQEFKDWYKSKTGKTLNEPVFFGQQTWGNIRYVKSNWAEHLWGKQNQGVFVLRWSDARKMMRTCYAMLPDLQGFTPDVIKWRLENQRERHNATQQSNFNNHSSSGTLAL